MLIATSDCKKTGSSTNTRYVTIKALEDKTGKPVEGVALSVQSCRSDYMNEICDEVLSGNTDKNGEFKFEYASYNVVIASHSLYWRTGAVGTEVNMIPESWQKVHLQKSNTYQPNAKLVLSSASTEDIPDPLYTIPLGSLIFGIDFYESIKLDYLPADTIVYVRSLGNYHDYVSWGVHSDLDSILANGQTVTQLINRFDTATVEITF